MWLTRTNWNDGDQPNGNDFNNFGRDIRTWGGQVDAANNPLVNLSLMRLNPAALPAVPSAGSFLYDIADSNLKFYNGTAWWVVGGVTAGLGDPGANGLLKRTALLVTAVAAAGTDYYAPGHAVALGDLPSIPWAKLTGAPTVPTLVSQLTNDSGFLTAASSLAWGKLTGVPSTFTPAAHAATHAGAGSDPISISGSQVSGNIGGNAAGFTGNLAGDVSGPQGTTLLATMSGLSAGAYGDASHVAVITVDVKGRVTAVSTQAISGVGGGMADPGSNGILKRTALNTTGIATAADLPAHASYHAGAGGDPLTSLGAMTFTGNLIFGTDNSYDIGAAAATRPRALYVAGAGTFGGTVTANQFTGSGAGLGSATVPIASLVAGDFSAKLSSGTYTLALSATSTVPIAALAAGDYSGKLSSGTYTLALSATSTVPIAALAASMPVADISFVIDGGGSAVTTGVKGDLRIDFACTINAWTLLADQSGSAVVNIWKVAYASFPPTSSNKITASAPPTLSSAAAATSSTLTGWTTSIAAGDVLRFNVDSNATCQRIVLCLKVTKA